MPPIYSKTDLTFSSGKVDRKVKITKNIRSTTLHLIGTCTVHIVRKYITYTTMKIYLKKGGIISILFVYWQRMLSLQLQESDRDVHANCAVTYAK